MADVLDQSEVDALLAAVETGGVETAADRTLVSRPATPPREIHAYDFKRPERVSKEQMRALEGIHESFGRNFGAFLSGFLRTIVEIRLATAEPLEGQLCLEISPLIIYPVIDRLLGGSNSELFIPQRPLTMIEQRLVGRITDRALTVLTESWSELVDVKFKITEVESNPHLVQMVAPNEVVVVLGFEIKMAGRAGTMSLCIPFNVIEPVMGKLLSQGWLAYQRRTPAEDKSEDIARGLGATFVDMVVYLAETSITLGDLLTLQPGDILQTTKAVGAEIIVQVEGQNKFAGIIGRHKENVAAKITRLAEVEEPL